MLKISEKNWKKFNDDRIKGGIKKKIYATIQRRRVALW